jgi:hypothetical protein
MTKAATTKPTGFDFDAFNTTDASEQGAEFEVQHPVNGPTGLFISMNGTHSDRVKAELKRIGNRAKAARNGTVRKDDDDEGAKFLASVTLGWRTKDGSPVTLLGEELPFSKENAFRVYKQYPLLAEQATAFVFQPANFLKG